ncbi:uncharacterized protein LOC118315576 isoform X2 [Scophthalmus maximus]|uniref:uncharacterized protein LOC118315576 isoform X2 n=1 Tax=Scophthalmus maximus TaxID=52904 RepID=UPI001FA8AC9D|nr:uncharacterized protein LOC118315576 isoform X2 [Scophthalmus maximus]
MGGPPSRQAPDVRERRGSSPGLSEMETLRWPMSITLTRRGRECTFDTFSTLIKGPRMLSQEGVTKQQRSAAEQCTTHTETQTPRF